MLDPADPATVIGCVYLYPPSEPDCDVEVLSWVRADHAADDEMLADAVHDWLLAGWPWRRIDRYGR